MSEHVWDLLDRQVAAGRIPGYVAALRVRGRTELRAGGRRAFGGPPMTEDTLFRIASVTKPIGGALALSLVQDGVIALDDPVDRWLPEAAEPRVLRDPAGPLDDTQPAAGPVTVRQLLNGTSGWGVVMTEGPLQAAMIARGIYGSSLPRPHAGDEFARLLCGLPLAFQPGTGWMYESGMDLLGLLLERATGSPLHDLVRERITAPLGMAETAFVATDPARLATLYRPGPGCMTVADPPDGVFSRPAPFEELSSGLVSTAGDVLRFLTAMADGGSPVLTTDSVSRMTTGRLTAEQRAGGRPILEDGESWGLGTAVDVEAARPWMAPGRWGWTGGTGTTAHVDPSRDLVTVLLTQREMTGPDDGFDDFWAACAAAAS